MIECTARYAAIRCSHMVTPEHPIRTKKGRIDYSSVRMSATDEKVVLERYDDLLDKNMRYYLDPCDEVVIEFDGLSRLIEVN